MLHQKRRTLLRLHEPPRRVPIHIIWRADAHIARALLHDNSEDNAFLDADLSGFDHGVVDAADVFGAVARS